MSNVIEFSKGPAPRIQLPQSPRGCRVAVIGAGFSGVLTAVHLLWRCRPGERVYLVERGDAVGQGIAYATPNPRHLLNVRVENMSAFSDEPDHFVRWIERLPDAQKQASLSRTGAGTFASRGLYGAYVQDILADCVTRLGGSANFFLVADEAVALRPVRNGIDLVTGCGRVHAVDAAVLALGNFPPDQRVQPGYVGDPWRPGATQGLSPKAPVLLIGTGLTMVDTCLELLERGFEGPIIALSRRGLLPQPHAAAAPWPGLRIGAEDRRSLAALTRAIRREARRAAGEGLDWRAMMDALRPHVRLLWQELSPDDRRRFLRHARPWWDSHRHRIAPSVARTIGDAQRRGQLRVLAGRILDMVSTRDAQVTVVWRPRHGDGQRSTAVQRVINCSGPGTDMAQLDDPLVLQLLGDGLARPDPFRLGLDTTPLGAVVDRRGVASSRMFAVGPLTRGTFWEITSVADIRVQAEAVALSALDAARRLAAAA